MKVTFLGHQGWHFEESNIGVLLDPIQKEMGIGLNRLPVYPPRIFDFRKLDKIHAVIISHEHTDHFDIPTLLVIRERCNDIYLPQYASRSLIQAVQKMRFNVFIFESFRSTKIGDMNFTPLPMAYNKLEFEVQGLFVESCSTKVSFLTSVDGVLNEESLEWLENKDVVYENFTNNYITPLDHLSDVNKIDSGLQFLTQCLIEYMNSRKPSNVIMNGQGWRYPVPFTHLNASFFQATNEKLIVIARQLFPNINFSIAEYGDSWGQLGYLGNSKDIFYPVEQDTNTHNGFSETFGWSNKKECNAQDWLIVSTFMQEEFGRFVSEEASYVVKGLFELNSQRQKKHISTLFIRLKDHTKSQDFELDISNMRFRDTNCDKNPANIYALGIEVWANDIYLLINGYDESYLIYETSVKRWNHYPSIIDDDFVIDIFSGFNPRKRPDKYLARYIELIEYYSKRLEDNHV